MRLIDLDKAKTHKQLEPNGNGVYKAVEIVYKNDLENLEVWTPKDVTLWYLTQNNITKIEDTRKGHEKTYELVQHGRWLHGREISRDYIGDACVAIHYEKWWCSKCNYIVDGKPLWNYCPNCGAQMEEQNE